MHRSNYIKDKGLKWSQKKKNWWKAIKGKIRGNARNYIGKEN